MEQEEYKDTLEKVKQCLTSGNSVFISDPRPALKILNKALEKLNEEQKDNQSNKES